MNCVHHWLVPEPNPAEETVVRDKDGVLLGDAVCKKCGEVKTMKLSSNYQYSDFTLAPELHIPAKHKR